VLENPTVTTTIARHKAVIDSRALMGHESRNILIRKEVEPQEISESISAFELEIANTEEAGTEDRRRRDGSRHTAGTILNELGWTFPRSWRFYGTPRSAGPTGT
jgi:hypothetical protein